MRPDVVRCAILGLLSVLVMGGAVEPPSVVASAVRGVRATESARYAGARVDTGSVEEALRHFYALYTSRDFDALYGRAAKRLREGGMSKANFRRFMRKKRKRLGPVRSISIDGPEDGPRGETVQATARVRYANGSRVERWRLSVEDGTVWWHSFKATKSSGQADLRKGASGDRSVAGKQVTVGQPIPSFEIEALHDSARTFTPSDLEGQYVLLNFWATWCAPCVDKIPTLRTAYRRYEDAFTLLNVSFDRSRSAVTRFLETHDLPGHHAFLGMRQFRGALATRLGIESIPNPILVGPDGRVVASEQQIRTVGLLPTLEREVTETSNE